MKKLDLNNLPDLLRPREVSDIFRVSVLTVKRWGDRGDLKFIRINSRGDRRIPKSEVKRILNNEK